MNAATAVMLDGIKEACSAWGRAMRWILSSEGEGYPTVASFERANQGDMDANTISLKQRFGEVMTKDALAVSLAMRRVPIMPEELHRVMFVHFVIAKRDAQGADYTVAMKAADLGYNRTKPYYLALDNGYHFLLGRIIVDVDIPRVPNIAHTMLTA
jgi:hypothetical protein